MIWASSNEPIAVGRHANRYAGRRSEQEKEDVDEVDRSGEVV